MTNTTGQTVSRSKLEHQIQSTAINMVQYMMGLCPELDVLYAIPNGGNRDAITGKMLKREGVKAGMPDLHLPVARHGFNSLYIEVKTPEGRLSKVQRAMIEKLQQHGNAVYVCRSTEDILQTLRDYLEE